MRTALEDTDVGGHPVRQGERAAPHFCPGASLARLELRVMLDVLVDELGDATLTGPPWRLRSSWLNGIKHLPLSCRGLR